MTEQEYADHENWLGSFYELGIEYGLSSAQQLQAALRALWQHPLLEGPVLGPYAAPPPALTPATISSITNMDRHYGALHVPQRRGVGCFSLILCPGTDPIEELAARTACWVMLCVPVGMLELAYPIEYPITAEANPWINQFERELVGIAEFVYQQVPFDLAVIGEEATAFHMSSTLTASDLVHGGCVVSSRLVDRLKPDRVPESFPSGLLWFPWATR